MLPFPVKPMLATMAEPFESSDYTYEIKWDGYRTLAFLDSDTRLQSRNLKDMTYLFPELSRLHQTTTIPGCVLDGEIIALRNGKPSFPELQKRGRLRKEEHIQAAVKNIPVVFIVFDLLYFNHHPLFDEPIESRRQMLHEHFKNQSGLVLTKYIQDQGLLYFKTVSELKLEGVIAKKKESRYFPGKRSKAWLKFKRKQRKNFIICGFTVNPTSRGELSSLILGAYLQHKLSLFGMVGTGFTSCELNQILKELTTIQTDICPFTGVATQQKNVFWTKPIIVCEVEYLELTDGGSLRHPSFQRFRPDLRPEDCQFEME